MHRELDVRAAGVHPDLADALDGHVAQKLILRLRERLRRGDGDRVPGVHAHRVEVLDRADHDHVIGRVAHDLVLNLFPADHRLLDEHLVHRAGVYAAQHHLVDLVGRVDLPAADAAEGRGRPHHDRQSDLVNDLTRLADVGRGRALGHSQPRAEHCVAEKLAVLRLLDRLARGADQLHVVARQDTALRQRERGIQAGLPAERRQQGIRALAIDDRGDGGDVERLHVGPGRHLRIGHDRGRVRVNQRDLVALLHEGLAGLGAGVVELARLSDDDGAGADNQDLVQIVAPGHASSMCLSG